MANPHEPAAASLSGGLVMLTKVLGQLPPSEKKLADYILLHPMETVQATARELGQSSLTSSAAVMRLCKTLGLKGFPELKIRIAGDMRADTKVKYLDVASNDTQKTVVEKMTGNSLQAIRETSAIINYVTLNRAVDAIRRAESLHFFGVGASGIIAQDAQQKFIRIQKRASAFSDSHLAAMNIAGATGQDAVLGISFSGQTREVAKILELAKRKGAVTISLTSFGTSLVSRAADINLFTSASQEATFRSGGASSRLAQLHMIDILFMCVVSGQYDAAFDHLHNTKAAVNYLHQDN